MTAIPLCVAPEHTILQAGMIARGRMRPEDAVEQARFSRLAAAGRDAEMRAVLRCAARMARLHLDNREWAIRAQNI